MNDSLTVRGKWERWPRPGLGLTRRYLPLAEFRYGLGAMPPADTPIAQPRRLSDKLLAAFDQACEQGRLEAAELVLKAIEIVLTEEAAPIERERRSHLGPVVEAFGRLKALREKSGAYSRQA
jgi:hypothetical protein